ncbi:fish-egg lectin-like [Protopterus annectens]|uniref:fish-egg lectin-like n=1 Tax=Protopterus annectens TaxID=7888 RepID=UPI001CFA2AAE|nr:fish-egg lectin-like [Protopterus annectens]
MKYTILLLLNLWGPATAIDCEDVDGSLKQIDVSNGQVFGVNDEGNIYTRYMDSWVQIPGALIHVTVGPAGVWGVNKNYNIYKLVGGYWVQVQGLLKQIDAGGAQYISGANMNDDIFCLNRQPAASVRDGSGLPWVNIAGKLKHYACGPYSCWGVNSIDDIYFRYDVTVDGCQGSKWQQIPGKLSMIEVGTDGSVYGVNSLGDVYYREGITASNPIGTSWTQVAVCGGKIKYASYDLGKLWLITDDGKILKCKVV